MAETARKIKVVIGEKNFNIGGIQRVALDLVRHLDKSKFEVFLITLQQWHDRGTFYDTVPAEVPIFRLNLNHWSSIREWYTLVRTLNHIKPDVVRSSSFFCNAVFRILQPLFGYRVIASEHNTMLQRGRLHTLANMLLSPMTYITVGVSQMVVDELAESGGFVRSKLKVIHNGIDLDAITRAKQRYRKSTLRTNLGLQPQDKVFLSVARFFKQKNHSLMIHAFKRLTELRDDCKLLLIGHGVLFEESRSLARSLGVEDRVIFLGEQREVYPFYVASDFFIMTSLHEGLSLACLEALAFGLPLISTKVSGTVEFLQDGKNGFFVTEDINNIAEKMNRIASLPLNQLKEFEKCSVLSAIPYSLDLHIRAHEELFLRAANRQYIRER